MGRIFPIVSVRQGLGAQSPAVRVLRGAVRTALQATNGGDPDATGVPKISSSDTGRGTEIPVPMRPVVSLAEGAVRDNTATRAATCADYVLAVARPVGPHVTADIMAPEESGLVGAMAKMFREQSVPRTGLPGAAGRVLETRNGLASIFTPPKPQVGAPGSMLSAAQFHTSTTHLERVLRFTHLVDSDPPEELMFLLEPASKESPVGFVYSNMPFMGGMVSSETTGEDGNPVVSYLDVEIVNTGLLRVHPGSTALNYATQCFEGATVVRGDDGKLRMYGIDEHIDRFVFSMQTYGQPAPSRDALRQLIEKTISANAKDLNKGQRMYVRPLALSVGPQFGVTTKSPHVVLCITSIVGDYFKGLKAVSVGLADQQRSTEFSGPSKGGANYPGTMGAVDDAKTKGLANIIFTNPPKAGEGVDRTVDEAAAASLNFFQHKDNGPDTFVVTESPSKLNSITERLAVRLAKMMGYNIERRPVTKQEVKSGVFHEAGLFGTAAIVSPVNKFVGIEMTRDAKAKPMVKCLDNSDKNVVIVGNGDVGFNTAVFHAVITAFKRGDIQTGDDIMMVVARSLPDTMERDKLLIQLACQENLDADVKALHKQTISVIEE